MHIFNEKHNSRSDGSWDDGLSNDSADVPCGPLWPENAYRREMLDLSINKLQVLKCSFSLGCWVSHPSIVNYYPLTKVQNYP